MSHLIVRKYPQKYTSNRNLEDNQGLGPGSHSSSRLHDRYNQQRVKIISGIEVLISFSTLLQMTETLQMAASIAKTFVGLHEGWPEKGRKIFDKHKRECDNLLEAVKTTNTAMADMNSRFARLEACFPGTKRNIKPLVNHYILPSARTTSLSI